MPTGDGMCNVLKTNYLALRKAMRLAEAAPIPTLAGQN
jgi:hypothetical protein